MDSFLEHVTRCPRCRKMYEVMNTVKADMESKGSPIPNRISPEEEREWRRISADRSIELDRRRKKRVWQPAANWLLSAKFLVPATLLLVIVVAGYILFLSPVGQRDRLRSPDSGKLRLLAPVGHLTALPEEFSWTPIQGAEVYVLAMTDEKLNRIFFDDTLKASTRIPLPEKLRNGLGRGQTYVWTVTATDENSLFLATQSASFVID